MTERPKLRLLPKTDARRIRHGYPWVYDNELVRDRRTRKIVPGTIATLCGADLAPLATVAVTPGSRITARVLDLDPEARIDRSWIENRLTTAHSLRARLFDAPYYRLIHAEADGLPGVVIDRFCDAAVIQPNAAWADRMIEDLAEATRAVTGARTIIKNASGRARALEGLDDTSAVLSGHLEGPVPVTMNRATYLADLAQGQKTGLFFDQRPNHAFVAGLARDTDVLDVFSHVGGFSLAALAAGARTALAVDGSAAALDLAREGAALTGVADRFTTLKSDAFTALETLSQEGRSFATVICDPPAFAPSKPALQAGLRAYERVARLGADLTSPAGTLTLCSCSHAADLAQFRAACIRGIGKAGRSARLIRTGFAGPDHPIHPALGETAYLKALTFYLA